MKKSIKFRNLQICFKKSYALLLIMGKSKRSNTGFTSWERVEKTQMEGSPNLEYKRIKIIVFVLNFK